MAEREGAHKPDEVKRQEIGAEDARAQLGELIDRAGFKGERIVITRHGKPLVALIGMDDLAALDAA